MNTGDSHNSRFWEAVEFGMKLQYPPPCWFFADYGPKPIQPKAIRQSSKRGRLRQKPSQG
jgi:hypothetical protein